MGKSKFIDLAVAPFTEREFPPRPRVEQNLLLPWDEAREAPLAGAGDSIVSDYQTSPDQSSLDGPLSQRKPTSEAIRVRHGTLRKALKKQGGSQRKKFFPGFETATDLKHEPLRFGPLQHRVHEVMQSVAFKEGTRSFCILQKMVAMQLFSEEFDSALYGAYEKEPTWKYQKEVPASTVFEEVSLLMNKRDTSPEPWFELSPDDISRATPSSSGVFCGITIESISKVFEWIKETLEAQGSPEQLSAFERIFQRHINCICERFEDQPEFQAYLGRVNSQSRKRLDPRFLNLKINKHHPMRLLATVEERYRAMQPLYPSSSVSQTTHGKSFEGSIQSLNGKYQLSFVEIEVVLPLFAAVCWLQWINGVETFLESHQEMQSETVHTVHPDLSSKEIRRSYHDLTVLVSGRLRVVNDHGYTDPVLMLSTPLGLVPNWIDQEHVFRHSDTLVLGSPIESSSSNGSFTGRNVNHVAVRGAKRWMKRETGVTNSG